MSAAKVFARYRLSVNHMYHRSFFFGFFFYPLLCLLSITRTQHLVSKTDICSDETEINRLPSYHCFRLFHYFSFVRLDSLSKGKETITLF